MINTIYSNPFDKPSSPYHWDNFMLILSSNFTILCTQMFFLSNVPVCTTQMAILATNAPPVARAPGNYFGWTITDDNKCTNVQKILHRQEQKERIRLMWIEKLNAASIFWLVVWLLFAPPPLLWRFPMEDVLTLLPCGDNDRVGILKWGEVPLFVRKWKEESKHIRRSSSSSRCYFQSLRLGASFQCRSFWFTLAILEWNQKRSIRGGGGGRIADSHVQVIDNKNGCRELRTCASCTGW